MFHKIVNTSDDFANRVLLTAHVRPHELAVEPQVVPAELRSVGNVETFRAVNCWFLFVMAQLIHTSSLIHSRSTRY